ncbi:hypothetical protein BBKW_1768 [Bifidobacterium catenulatum subsp. kashiwanohense JCM 15439 = DSM 21854]|nr:hypothetical protein BBKW_1768 [Bifidobacterium catenulatum subsp. kashiwanohense JCM 15439 = DSM 21854]
MILLWLLAAPVHVPQVFAGPREAGIQNMTLFQGAQRLKTAET